MAKVTAPLLSMGARGQVGKTQVYAGWRGVPYARKYVIPHNPKTASQVQTRKVFLWLNEVWKVMDSNVQAVWTAFAKGMPMTNRNMWQQHNLPELRGTTGSPTTDLLDMTVSPGVNAGIAFASIAATDGGTHDISVAPVAPTLPTGWTLTKFHAIAWSKQSAATDTKYSSVYGSAASSPWTVSLSMGAAGDYDAFGFFEMTKPDGTTAYSPSLAAAVTIA